jgi:hypothetical protein
MKQEMAYCPHVRALAPVLTWYSGRNYRRQMSNGSILADEKFYILAPRNIWKLILFFSPKIFSQDESKRYIPTFFTQKNTYKLFTPNLKPGEIRCNQLVPYLKCCSDPLV